jgi:1-acyl-sn-glycerol-3-phosphate acyltransferase
MSATNLSSLDARSLTLFEPSSGIFRTLARSMATIRLIRGIVQRAAARPMSRQDMGEAQGSMGRNMCDIHGLQVFVEGTLPKTGAVLVCNHLSYLDPLALTCVHPGIPIAKLELSSWPFVGKAARALGTLFIDRDSPHRGATIIRETIRFLQSGVSVINFPEGTTTNGKTIEFKRGIFGAAQLAKAPVVPVRIEYETPDLHWWGGATFVPHYCRFTARRSSWVRLRIGTPIPHDPQLTSEELAALAWTRVEALATR